ncbi:DUF397 domain-containing protein [Streptomyces millisiae]|uniref:DUF397 domain-containing protein n=1 Tax=Streptomyces millisiae TaxID=3075542 RepID=A0ABU2LPM3_9ACTN|nr:DUF397 domain-containing protein [Streptomyces sp. DSM 44918]MDT0319537.1 DUF397 domain-containing protein [Streptomyces sp. DSM 44918]
MTAQREAAGARWHVSSYSNSGNNCLEHGRLADGTQIVRDTKDRARAALVLTPGAWRGFVDAARAGAFGREG